MKHYDKHYKAIFGVLFAMLAVIAACAPNVQSRTDAVTTAVPAHEQANFIEAKNINRRLQLFDDQNLISWIVMVNQLGQPIDSMPVQGKVTSSGKRLEPNSVATCVAFKDTCTDERIQADGTFGSSDAYIFWFDPQGNYHQWNGLYYMSNVPIKLSEVVLHTADVDANLSAKVAKAQALLAAGKCVDANLDEAPCGLPQGSASPAVTPTPVVPALQQTATAITAALTGTPSK